MIEARGIRKRFGTLEVLKGIDLQVEEHEIVAIMGASGAGKSTLLQILGTLSTPDAGSLRLDGEDVLRLKGERLAAFRGKRIGFVFQAHHLLPEFSALENVMMPALIAGVPLKAARAKAVQLLEEVGLGGRQGHKPNELSGGEQQRVAIARALVNDPAVLFADEPTGNLDSATKQEIHRLLLELRERLGQTIVIVTHDPELAALCDRTMTMRDGMFI
jgi:lipoprotein-releasing system ATP-binding protein